MMTEEARIPSDSTGWRAIDIFVFTNGQQHSPPRKYHLNAQELNWWKAILSFLARSQYGSLHSTIDLYTVDGEKLEGPLQLSNGASYVAVKPPDHFINTGYSKYLVKASRSWEKSQARRSNSNEITKPDECNNPLMVPNIDASNKKAMDEIQVNNTITPDNKVIERPHTLLNIHEYPQRDSSALNKQSDKKRISPIQRSSILRKSVTTPSSTKKDSWNGKDVPKNSKIPLKINEKPNVKNGGNVTKAPQKTGKETSAIKPEQIGLIEKEAPLIPNSSNTNILVVDKTNNEALHEKDDSVLVSHIYKSTDSKIRSVVVPLSISPIVHDIEIQNNITEELNSNETKITTHIFNNLQKSDMSDTLAYNTFTPSSLENNLSNEMLNMSQIQRAPNVSFADIPDQSYVVINNGDIGNLKLQIEVRNSGGTVNKKNKNEQKNYSSANIVKTEKGSQIDLDSEMIQSKSLQSIFVSEFIENVGIHRNSGVIVIKCACCQENKNKVSNIAKETSLNDNKMYVILLPTPGHDNNILRCQCDNKIIDIIDKETRETHRSSLINPVKKTTSKIDLEILNSSAEVSKVTEFPKIESETKHHVAIIEKDIINQRDIDESISKIDNVDHGLTIDNTSMIAKCKETSDKATQTELCSLLLEARRHEDGLYSFHLPPLHILKYYKL